MLVIKAQDTVEDHCIGGTLLQVHEILHDVFQALGEIEHTVYLPMDKEPGAMESLPEQTIDMLSKNIMNNVSDLRSRILLLLDRLGRR